MIFSLDTLCHRDHFAQHHFGYFEIMMLSSLDKDRRVVAGCYEGLFMFLAIELTGATPERPSTPTVERLQRAGARAVGALTFGHACRAPGEQCATAQPDALDFLLRSTFDALPIDVASPESLRRPPHNPCN